MRQLEREVSALEKRSCVTCAAAASTSAQPESERSAPEPDSARSEARSEARRDAHSDTESVGDMQAQAQISLLKEQLERAEAQLQVKYWTLFSTTRLFEFVNISTTVFCFLGSH